MLKNMFGKKEETPQNTETISLEIEGMTCGGCSSHIEKNMNGKEGVVSCAVNWETGKGEFTIDKDKLDKSAVVDAVNGVGSYKVKNGVEKEACCDTDSGDSAPKTISNDKGNSDYDLIIIGGGSAAFSAMTTANGLGLSVMLINGGLDIGGTCVNVGCVPSKHLIRAGESIHKASHSPFAGITPVAPKVDYGQIIRDKKDLVLAMREKKYLKVAKSVENVNIVEGWANFVDDKTIEVNGKNYTASKFLVSTGATTNIPNIEGLQEVGYLTNISLFDMEEKPKSLTVLGAGYIGLEMAQAFARLGVKIRVLEFTDRVLRTQTEDVSAEIQKQFATEGIEVLPNVRIQKVEKQGDNILIHAKDAQGNAIELIEEGHLVVATGTKPNTLKMNIENAGVELTEKGHIKVNSEQETNVANIYAAGDCTDTPAFVYTAAVEGKNAVLNAFNGETNKADYSALPWVVFTDPQIAGVGLDEKEAEAQGIPFDVTSLPVEEIPRAAAALDTRGFVKLIRNADTDKIIGARVVAPEGGELIMEAALAVKYGITATELAETFHPYLTMSEGIKIAAITFTKDVAELSCCAT
jgi:mercuric reductase